ncbi:MAG: 6,7-dimethyl-8-ribityllumazine synthase [Desulfotomaculum sp. 46_296]|nr:MAG: 6,7-dimethyl-8-ribityllumazine synthase [Desulfotomaculum sp. 46_296]HAU31683.1 6,7-dimethyl-8-ribityllumazine synthase [Desulfotomaculum sp.]
MKVYEGNLIGQGLKFGVVVGRFNEFITNRLLSGALDTLKRHGVADDDIEVAWVPGAFEIPAVARQMIGLGRFDAVVCLGAVIRGATPHFEHVAAQVSRGVARISLDSGVPVTFGVILADSIEQAIERAGTKAGNKGGSAAEMAIEMANLLKAISGGKEE